MIWTADFILFYINYEEFSLYLSSKGFVVQLKDAFIFQPVIPLLLSVTVCDALPTLINKIKVSKVCVCVYIYRDGLMICFKYAVQFSFSVPCVTHWEKKREQIPPPTPPPPHPEVRLLSHFPSSMSRAVHPQEFLKLDVDHRHIPLIDRLEWSVPLPCCCVLFVCRLGLSLRLSQWVTLEGTMLHFVAACNNSVICVYCWKKTKSLHIFCT